MEYGKIISRSWTLVWDNKWLFVLGFLAALGSGGGSGSGGNFNTGSPGSGSDFDGIPSDFGQTMSEIAPFLIAAICVIFIIAIGLWLLRLIGESGMIASVNRIEAGESLGFKDGFRAGTGQLKNMVGLSLILYGPFILVSLIIAGAVLFTTVGSVAGNSDGAAAGFGLLALCIVPLGCLIAVGGLVVTFLYPMAQRSIIIKGMPIMDGIKDGWQVLRTNFGEIFVLGLIYFLIGLVVGFASLFVAVPLIIIFLLPMILAIINGGTVLTVATVIFAILGVIAFVLVSAAISSIVRTMQSTSFTLAYHQWIGKKPAVVV